MMEWYSRFMSENFYYKISLILKKKKSYFTSISS